MRKTHKTQQGQSVVEFALIAIVLLALVFALMDLARAGFMQHDLDAGAGDLASHLAALSGTSSSGDPNSPNGGTTLDPTVPVTTTFSTDPTLDPSLATTEPVSAAIQGYLDHAAQTANYKFSNSPLTKGATTTTGTTATTTLTNGQVTVVATSDLTNTSGLTNTTELTVTVTTPFTPVVGFLLNNAVLHLQARASALTPTGQLAQ